MPSKCIVNRIIILLFCASLLALSGCSGDRDSGCLSCHEGYDKTMDTSHNFSCITCHGGQDRTDKKKKAHNNLIARPASPSQMNEKCGECHKEITAALPHTSHYTLAPAINLFRNAYNAQDKVQSFAEVNSHANPQNPLELADDLLRRRCFRCHLFSPGDEYNAVRHGVGCAACHIQLKEGSSTPHSFQQPGDEQCLSCHYGNYVGADYYGHFEPDFTPGYRAPWWTSDEAADARPWGVEYIQLVPDIHQQKGMQCIDCHSGSELMKGGQSLTCISCHDGESLQADLPGGVKAESGTFTFTDHSGQIHPLPLMQNPAHLMKKVDCQVCHAQWGFNDMEKHYLRSDIQNDDPFLNLAIQGSSEVERIVQTSNTSSGKKLPLVMTDKITGKAIPGVWYKGFLMRRWEEVQLGRRADGTITTVRPLLDYQISWIDKNGELRIDSVHSYPARGEYQPYTPHTTGSAGSQYLERIRLFHSQERDSEAQPPLWIKATPIRKKK
ncbi:hypothetical protein JWG39_15090 [Desulforhopalus vacuolatus]|uniref:hypothetical protein n=1 Tax=Desulforhopalus vacuolatus TaxID=40414 RepID=UPI0019662DD8|nr:hypothetical protein [Desulforhopalus vacuolatus]MBM9521146.1 hypothetical protein [Desulforhopalus vacuolatus]